MVITRQTAVRSRLATARTPSRDQLAKTLSAPHSSPTNAVPSRTRSLLTAIHERTPSLLLPSSLRRARRCTSCERQRSFSDCPPYQHLHLRIGTGRGDFRASERRARCTGCVQFNLWAWWRRRVGEVAMRRRPSGRYADTECSCKRTGRGGSSHEARICMGRKASGFGARVQHRYRVERDALGNGDAPSPR